MRKYINLLRIKHYIKNLLIFVPLFFGDMIFNKPKMRMGILGLICFCLISSAVYILNDLKDLNKDKLHPTKRNRPLASGQIKPTTAIIIMLLCIMMSCIVSIYLRNWMAFLLLILYFCLNVIYSMGLKNIPIVDIVILASGFVIRIFYGGIITNITISKWLYLVITVGSLYMGLGKRRNELKKQTKTRDVLKYYNVNFLDKNMYVALSIVFYSLWTLEMPNPQISWTIPIFIILLMCYSLDVEGDSDGDPVEVILHDKILIGLLVLYALFIFILLYLV